MIRELAMSEKKKKIRITESGKQFINMVLLAVIIAVFAFSTGRFIVKRQKLTARRDELLAMIEEQETLSRLYEDELSRVGTPEYYEYMARRYLGYIYPDETILIVTNGSGENE